MGQHQVPKAKLKLVQKIAPIRGAAGCCLAPYDIPNAHTFGYDVVSNRSKVAAYRAPGAPIGAYAVECVLDEVAEALKMCPLDP